MISLLIVVVAIIYISTTLSIPETVTAAASSGDKTPVTCGSAIKLKHKETGNNLHSHQIAWGSGSGQQSVTCTGTMSDPGSLWIVKSPHNAPMCTLGTPINCNEVIRLEHSQSGKNLHSHLFKSPLSNSQEVSAFGDNGFGDTGDNWRVVCEGNNEKTWNRGDIVLMVHADTGKLLYTADNYKFNQQNCGHQCPIMDQTEVSGSSKRDAKAKWMTGQGVYIDPKVAKGDDKDDEL